MRTINLPGFGAEAALHTSRDYRHARMPVPSTGHVVPQLSVSCAITAGRGLLNCLGGPLDPGTCALLARMQYSVCDMLESTPIR